MARVTIRSIVRCGTGLLHLVTRTKNKEGHMSIIIKGGAVHIVHEGRKYSEEAFKTFYPELYKEAFEDIVTSL